MEEGEISEDECGDLEEYNELTFVPLKASGVSQDDPWDDSLLIEAWDEAVEEFKQMAQSELDNQSATESLKRKSIYPLKFPVAEKQLGSNAQSQHRHQSKKLKSNNKKTPLQQSSLANAISPEDSALHDKENPLLRNHPASALHEPPTVNHSAFGQEGPTMLSDNDDFNKMLMAWYYAGYYTGYHHGTQRNV